PATATPPAPGGPPPPWWPPAGAPRGTRGPAAPAAAALADALLRVSRQRSVKPGTSATARLLVNTAALAASSGESWQWRIEHTAGGEH
ncbi:hypothetical protein ACFVJI_31895, partial [Streptomyces sp. NPDC127584]|uniref:DUF7739 domain-containing protein n=1 Tax=Streptomyces sp. NPDC127584 TaxID=3345403 RepID=UPI0036298E68